MRQKFNLSIINESSEQTLEAIGNPRYEITNLIADCKMYNNAGHCKSILQPQLLSMSR